MVQGINKEYIFHSNWCIEKYLRGMRVYSLEHNVSILAYCIMNNHAHMLVYVENIENLSSFMKKLNQNYAIWYNKTENRCGVLFRNRYEAEPIYNKRHLITCIKYIHNNPVKANIVANCADYRYSSYTEYFKNYGCARAKFIQQIFGKEGNFDFLFQHTYERKFMDTKDSEIDVDFYFNSGLQEFLKKSDSKLVDLLTNEDCFCKCVRFLNEDCGFTLNEIARFFKITKHSMESIKKTMGDGSFFAGQNEPVPKNRNLD